MSHAAAASNLTTERYEVEVVRDLRIPTGEPGVTLSADAYLPAGAGPVPALVVATPYRKDAGMGIEAEPQLRWFAERGYACLLFDFRGYGSSDGRMRRPYESSEADDGVAVVEWAAAQPWCDGAVGMWGLSYASLMAMRTASLRPPALKAIVPVMGPLDAEHDFVHPCGVRNGGIAPILWGTSMLAHQLLPTLHNFQDADEQRRWRQRAEQDEPWLLDLVRHGPGHQAWRECTFDPAAIEVPALVVAGWWDLLREGQLRAYELMQGPKRLLAGPWMHSMPHSTPIETIDFLPLMLRWWDHWLRGVDDGLMDEPPVTLYLQGGDPGWRAYESWPPPPARELTLSTGTDTTLAERTPAAAASTTAIAEYRPDPTIGTTSGLWGVLGQTYGLPMDQHEDDSRCASATSEPLAEDLLIAGRAAVEVRLTSDSAAAQRLVVRLCEVDPEGRSTLVTTGVAVGSQRIVLDPTAYRFRAGHRLRVALSDSDFPRLWPPADAATLQIAGVELVAPVVSKDAGLAVEVPALDEPDPDAAGAELWSRPSWQIIRHPVQDEIEVVHGCDVAARTANDGHQFEMREDVRVRVRRDAPEAATSTATAVLVARLTTGEVVEVTATSRLSATALSTSAKVTVDGVAVFSRSWDGLAGT